MKPNFKFRSLLSGSTFLAMIGAAQAQSNYYWDSNGGGSAGFGLVAGTWGTSNFWNTDSAGGAGTFSTTIPGTTNIANFGTSIAGYNTGGTAATGTVTLSGAHTVGAITVGSASGLVTIATTGTNILNIASGGIVTNNSSNTLAITGAGMLGGSGGFTKQGSGTLQFATTGSVANTGAMQIDSGTVLISSTSFLGSLSKIVLNGSSASLRWSNTSTQTLSYAIDITANGGTFSKGNTGTYTVNGTITSTGTGNRTLTLHNDNTSGSAIFSSALANPSSGTLGIEKTGVGTWVFDTNAKTYTGDTTITAGTLRIDSGSWGSSGNYGGNISIAGTFSYNSAVNQTLSGNISGAGTFLKPGAASTLILSGTGSTFSGAIGNSTSSITGTLVGIGANAFGSTTGITLAGAGILSLRGDSSTNFVKASDSSAYSVIANASGSTINVDRATVAGTGAKTMTIGTLTTNSVANTYLINFTGANNTSLSMGAVTGPVSTSNATPGSVTFSNAIASTGALTLASYTSANAGTGAGAAETVTFTGTGNTTVTGAITPSANPLSLTKAGAGTLTLSGTNTYTGATNVSSGILVINGNQSAATGNVSVTGTLAGNGGTIGGNTTINATGKLAMGDGTAKSIGTETFSGTLAFVANSIFEWDLDAPNTNQVGADQGSYDKVVNNNATKMSGTSVFNVVLGTGDAFADAFWDTNKTWTNIFDGTGLATNLSSIFTSFSGAGIVNNAGVGEVAGRGSFSFNGSTTLTWTAVPEPTSALAGLLISAGLLRRRRA